MLGNVAAVVVSGSNVAVAAGLQPGGQWMAAAEDWGMVTSINQEA